MGKRKRMSSNQVRFDEREKASTNDERVENNSCRVTTENNCSKPDGRGMVQSPSVGTMDRLERSKIVIWKRPLQTIHYALREAFVLTEDIYIYLWKRKLVILLVLLLSFALVFVYRVIGSHQNAIMKAERLVLSSLYWIGLGILSSIGLGTGLHTFILYLGPHIASVTMAAYECHSLDFPEPPYPDSIICPDENSTKIVTAVSIWAIMSKVRFESLLWGFGTALGELPPYFMAKAARISGQEPDDEEYREFLAFINQNSPSRPSFTDRCKIFMEKAVASLGLIGILLFASVPNPFFDLAGITCGHFLVPFWTFFSATLIGKAVVKVHLQMLFVVLSFSEDHVEQIIVFLRKLPCVGPHFQSELKKFLQLQKAKLHNSSKVIMETSVLENMLSSIVAITVLWFFLSIVNSFAQRWHKRLCDQRKNEN